MPYIDKESESTYDFLKEGILMKRFQTILFGALALSSCAGDPISSASNPVEIGNFVYNLPRATSVQRLEAEDVDRLGLQAFEDVGGILDNAPGNVSVSPASYLLAVAGLASVSKNFPNASFGLQDEPINDLKNLLTAWNFEYASNMDSKDKYKSQQYCEFEAVVAHQTVGSKYRFDQAKRQSFVSDYVSTIESSLSSYYADANKLFHDLLKFTIPVPDPHLNGDAVLTYGGFRMKDYVPGGLNTAKKQFKLKKVDAMPFGNEFFPLYTPYLSEEKYEVFKVSIERTDLAIVLPKEGVDINEVSAYEAFAKFSEKRTSVYAIGYVPFFHVMSENLDLTAPLRAKMKGNEVFYDKLLTADTRNDLKIDAVLQNTDFEFNRYGVSGESITVIAESGAAAEPEHEIVYLNVDRPFYAISLKDGFPLFASKVVDIG